MTSIDLMIAGAQKAGTSTLKAALDSHPGVRRQLPLEADYFLTKEPVEWEDWASRYIAKGDGKVVCKQAFLTRDARAVRRLRDIAPQVRIVFVLREPVNRLLSGFGMGRADWIDFGPEELERILDAEAAGTYHVGRNALLKPGDYAHAAELLRASFAPEQIDWVLFEDLKRDAASVTSRILRGLDLPETGFTVRHENAAATVRSHGLQRLVRIGTRSTTYRRLRARLPYSTIDRARRLYERLNRRSVVATERVAFPDALLERLRLHYAEKNKTFTDMTGVTLPW